MTNVALAYHGLTVHNLVVLVATAAYDTRHHEVALQQLAYLLYIVAEHHRVGHLHREGVQCHLLQVTHTALRIGFFRLLVHAQHTS